jgi:hypothetical protein
MIEQPQRFVAVATDWIDHELNTTDRYDSAGDVSL